MTVFCPGCQRRIRVPPDKVATANLRARCAGCGTVFAVAEAAIAPDSPAGPPSASPPAAQGPATPPGAQAMTAPRTPLPAERSETAPPLPPKPAPAEASAVGTATAPPPAARPASPARARGRASWRICANHAGVAAAGVCGQCGRGLCAECATPQGSALICPTCDALCVPLAEMLKREENARKRARPLLSELGTVFAYPFRDKFAFVLFAVFVGVFSLAASLAGFGGGIGAFISQGLLYAYAFAALNRVSNGDVSSFMPNVSDWTDLVQPMRAGIAAMLISSGPLLGLGLMYSWSDLVAGTAGEGMVAVIAPTPTPETEPTLPPDIAAALQDDESVPADGEDGESAEDGEPSPDGEPAWTGGAPAPEPAPLVPAWAIAALFVALVWKIAYSPIALVAAAISNSFVATLNPVAGIGAIRRMGGVYWTAMGVYTAIAVVETVLVGVVSLVPLAGKLAAGFIQSYAFLAIGCLLGFAVFKKAPELGLD